MMSAPRTYATAGAFRRALEERLKKTSLTDQVDLNRLRRQVAFDRLLARLFQEEAAPWALKGGYALELRFRTARSTLDIDLTLQGVDASEGRGTNQVVREMLQNAANVPLGDWFEYAIGAPVMDLDPAPYGGARFPVEARMDDIHDLRAVPPGHRYWRHSHRASGKMACRIGWALRASKQPAFG